MYYYEMRPRIKLKEELTMGQNWSDNWFGNDCVRMNFQQDGIVSTVRLIVKRMVDVTQSRFE